MLRPTFPCVSCVVLIFLSISAFSSTNMLIADVTRIGNPNPATDAAFGNSVSGIADVNGDGIGDLLVGAPGVDKVYVISGKDQNLIATIKDPDNLTGYQFGFSVVTVGDWDGDGVADFAVGAPGQKNIIPAPCTGTSCPQWGRAFVFSGATGKLIKQFAPPEQTAGFGYAVAPLGKINGNNALAVGAPVLASGLGAVYAFSGADASLIWKSVETGTTQTIASFGFALATLTDINGDGILDLVVGAPSHDKTGAVYVLSGKDGTQSQAPQIPSTAVQFGFSVTNIGDQTGDGKDDYIVGDPKMSKAYLYSGADAGLLGTITSKQLNDSFGFAATTVGDYDGDNKFDFFISAPDVDHVYLFNAAGTELLDVTDPNVGNKSFGHALSATRDLGGDKGLDLLVGAPGEVNNSGASYLVTIRANRPPVANAGPDQLVECDRSGVVTLDGSASYDPDKDPITYSWKQVSGPVTLTLAVQGAKAQFTAAPPGVYEFQLTVSDDKGASSTDNVVVTIRDTIAPKVLVTLNPGSLWPPNHKMADIAASLIVTDACDPNPTIRLVSITSSEPVNSTGDGNTSPDIAGAEYGTDDRNFQLRAERKGNGNGRFYTALYSARDASDNVGTGSGVVTVAHNQMDVSQTYVSFTSTPVGLASSTQLVTLSNAGPDPLSVGSISLGGLNASDFSINQSCVPILAAESACSINIAFKPTGAGNRIASLTITSSADNSPSTIVLSGAAIAAQDYSIGASPNSATIKQGQSATFTLTVSPISGFNQSISFGCAGLPMGATCTFSPATLTPNGGPVSTALTITTKAPILRSRLTAPGSDWLWMQGGVFTAAVLLIPGMNRKKAKRRFKVFVTLGLLTILSLAIACGGSGSTTSSGSGVTAGATDPGTPTGTSSITVSTTAGTSSTTQHAVNLSITVTQ